MVCVAMPIKAGEELTVYYGKKCSEFASLSRAVIFATVGGHLEAYRVLVFP